MDAEADGATAEAAPGLPGAPRVAIVGAGPAGLAAAEWLARAGAAVTILEEHPYPGGMVGGAIPAYRLPQAQITQDRRSWSASASSSGMASASVTT